MTGNQTKHKINRKETGILLQLGFDLKVDLGICFILITHLSKFDDLSLYFIAQFYLCLQLVLLLSSATNIREAAVTDFGIFIEVIKFNSMWHCKCVEFRIGL